VAAGQTITLTLRVAVTGGSLATGTDTGTLVQNRTHYGTGRYTIVNPDQLKERPTKRPATAPRFSRPTRGTYN